MRTIGEPLYDCAHMRYPKYRKEKGLPELGMGNGVVVKGLQLEEMKMF